MRRRAKHWQHGQFNFFSSEIASLGHSHNWQRVHFHFFLYRMRHFKINFATLTLCSLRSLLKHYQQVNIAMLHSAERGSNIDDCPRGF